MSSTKLNLPMLSDYLLGEMMSSHDGVCCYPAIRRGTEDKYIVKVISVPDSPSRLDALLLTGAMPNKEAALDYFMTLAKDVLDQTDILRDLSHQEGFIPYLEGQIQPMDNGTGYEVYLLGTYRNSLERILRTDMMTHADVANMGLDLCAALAACRRTGYLYADLKPGNIFRDQEQGFRIGDVGFIALSSLKYASLPHKYRSSYTAPELLDDMAVLNSTVDIYALGLVLYQAYNGGVLPILDDAGTEVLPPPIYADYEMAEIILKACHPDPAQRWQEPTKMAHALIDYLQTYGAPETPIIPPVLDKSEEDEEPFLPEADPAELQKEIADLENAEPDELAFMSGLVSDETAPSEENTADVSDEVMTEELSEMFAQADELLSHRLPAPPVAPEPVFAPMPEPIVLEDETEEAKVEAEETPSEETPAEEAQSEATEEASAAEAVAAPLPASEPQSADEDEQPKEEKPFLRRIIVAAVLLLLLAAGWFLGQKYYNDYYLLHVDDLVLQVEKDTVTVQVLSSIDEQLLKVVCTDSYGNSTNSAVADGIATFTNLNPSTHYTVRVEVSGHHKLTGTTTDSFTTAGQIQVHSFIAGMGPDDCSVALNFTVSGSENANWTLLYSADGIAEQSLDFSGRSVVVSDLVAGALYTFTLVSPDGLYLAGQTQVQFEATNILYAQDLTITACGGGSLTAQWAQSEHGTVTEWRVRCFNDAGYNVTVTTSDLSYTFTELDHSTPCTVEVTAVGMNRSVSASIGANPVTVESFTCGFTPDLGLQISWEYSGQTPASGWVLRYRVDGGQERELPLAEATGLILAVPHAVYNFTIETADGSFVFNNSFSYAAQDVPIFSGYGVSAADMTWHLFLWPDALQEGQTDIPAENFKTEFTFGDLAGFLITLGAQTENYRNALNIQFVVHDAGGNLLTVYSAEHTWDSLWSDGHCLMPIPNLADAPGNYTTSVYFDGAFVWLQEYTVLEAAEEGGAQPE